MNYQNKIKLVLIFPVALAAGNLGLEFENNSGESSYIVESVAQDLKAKLIFPFKYYSANFSYEHEFSFFNIKLITSFLLKNKKTIGEDYDWLNNNLTVFSTSTNKIDNYSGYTIEISKKIKNHFTIITSFTYKLLSLYWQNTTEQDFIKNKTTTIEGTTLKYQQKIYQYNLGLLYKNIFTEKLSIELNPFLEYALIDSKDTHILRDFYTKQISNTYGYKLILNTTYKINNRVKVVLSGKYTYLKDTNTKMDYFNALDEKYLTLPSSFIYKNRSIGIGFFIQF